MASDPDPVAEEGVNENASHASRFAISLEELERSVQVPSEGQIIEIPASEPDAAPGDDDFTRELRALINPGL